MALDSVSEMSILLLWSYSETISMSWPIFSLDCIVLFEVDSYSFRRENKYISSRIRTVNIVSVSIHITKWPDSYAVSRRCPSILLYNRLHSLIPSESRCSILAFMCESIYKKSRWKLRILSMISRVCLYSGIDSFCSSKTRRVVRSLNISSNWWEQYSCKNTYDSDDYHEFYESESFFPNHIRKQKRVNYCHDVYHNTRHFCTKKIQRAGK